MTLIHQEIASSQLYQRADISDIYAISTEPDYKTYLHAGEIPRTPLAGGVPPYHTLPNTLLGMQAGEIPRTPQVIES